MSEPKKPAVSVRKETYERAAAKARLGGVSVSHFVDVLVTSALDRAEGVERSPVEQRAISAERMTLKDPQFDPTTHPGEAFGEPHQSHGRRTAIEMHAQRKPRIKNERTR